MKPKLDHIVIGAKTLIEGVRYVETMLGVTMPFGGEHVKMGTHNHLMQLGNDTFLEVIAIDNDALPPDRPRWYGLDDPYIRMCLEKQPSLLTWVVNTNNIEGLIDGATFSAGKPELISRGDLSWKFSLPVDGGLLGGGLLPYVIEWHADTHPSQRMVNLGCSILSIEIFHPYPEWLEDTLASIGVVELVKISALNDNELPFMSVELGTPNGSVKLCTATTLANSAGCVSSNVSV